MARTVFRKKPLATNGTDVTNGQSAPPPVPRLPSPAHCVGDELASEERLLPILLIDPSPWQRRKDFSGVEELAESLKSLGIRQAVLVRHVGSRYELLAGERRLRAAELAGWTTIRASVQQADDATAKQVVLVENLQRKDLNPIEEAQQWRELLAGDAAPTQTELAKKLGVTQGHISNRLRLLKLPGSLRDYVISGEMPPSVARDLVPVADCPPVIAAIVQRIEKSRKKYGPKASVAELLNDPYDGLGAIVDNATRPLEGKVWSQKTGGYVPYFTPTPEQREELGVRELVDQDGEKVERATNAKLWDELQAEHEAAIVEKAEKKRGTGGGGREAGRGDPKADAAEEKRKKAERSEQLARRKKNHIIDRMRHLIAEAIMSEVEVGVEVLLELLVLAANKGWAAGYSAREVDRALAKVKDRPIALRARIMLAEIFWNSSEDCPSPIVYKSDVEYVAKYLAIDLAKAWGIDQMGPLSEAWWNAHDREKLVKIAFAADMGVIAHSSKKGELVNFLVNRPMGMIPVPAELLKIGKKVTAKKARPAKSKAKGCPIGDECDAPDCDECED